VGAPSSGKLFICYRRSDSADITGRFYDRLVARFGRESVFKDVDSIPLGADFRTHIDATIQQCSAVIVVIGRDWLAAKSASGGRRLDEELDHVRIEIQSALKRDIPIIPVLVHDAEHPAPHNLPASIKELSFRNGASIRSDPHFNSDVNHIISHMERVLAPAPPPPLMSPPARAPEPAKARAPAREPAMARAPVPAPAPAVRETAAKPGKNKTFWVVLIVCAALGSLILVGGFLAMSIPAYQKVRESSQEKAILNNLRQLGAAADQYYLENGVATARLDQLVGPDKYVKSLTSVAGENYGEVQFNQGQPLVVHTASGREVRYNN